MKKKLKTNTSKEPTGYVCADCQRKVFAVYAKSVAKKQIKYVCWACSNNDEE